VRHAHPEGVRVAALLVAKLRFERLLRGSESVAARFEADPAGFAAEFRRYHRSVPPTAFWPSDEAALFARWRSPE
jgi:hypothetical protein